MTTVTIYGDSLLKFVLWENGRYLVNHEPIERFSNAHQLHILNRSYFGSCADKGLVRIQQDRKAGKISDFAVIEFGGNDCSFDWKAIAEKPDETHDSAVALPEYLSAVRSSIRELRAAGTKPLVTNMLPFDPNRYLLWVTRALDRETVLRWLGEENRVYRKNEQYCRALEKLAREEDVPIIDLRTGFLEQEKLREFYCEDGIHPNRAGHELIYRAFEKFIREEC